MIMRIRSRHIYYDLEKKKTRDNGRYSRFTAISSQNDDNILETILNSAQHDMGSTREHVLG